MSYPFRTSFHLLLAFFFLAISYPAWSAADEKKTANHALLRLAEEATKEAVSLRKLKAKDKVQTRVTTKKEVQAYIQQRFDETNAADEFMAFSKVLHILGVFEKAVPLDKMMQELLVEQVAGYYDWEKKTLYIADWLPEILQKPTLVHEVIHALQDQHFKLGRFMVPLKGYGDPLSAIQCLFEGDATVVMLDSMASSMGIKGGIPEEVESMLIRILETQMAQELSSMAGMEDVPPILSSMLVFPYLGGLKMVLSIRREGGWKSVNTLYKNLPLSTEQILHPEKLRGKKRDNPQDIRFEIPPPLMNAGWTQIGSDSFGEFGFREVLDHHLEGDKARTAASGWDGDRYLLLEKGNEGPNLLLWVSEWDSEDDATEAKEALQSIPGIIFSIAQDKTRVAAIWGEDTKDSRSLVQNLLQTARADEIKDYKTVVHRGTKK